MAMGSEEGSIYVYAWPEMECLATVDGTSGTSRAAVAITDLAFSPDGSELLSVAAERAT
jgi:hypothetical protein